MSISPNLKHFEKLQKCNQLDLDELIDILIGESIFLSESKHEDSDEFSDSFAILAMELINNLEHYKKIKSQQEAILILESEKRKIESNRDEYIKSVSQYMRIYQSITKYFSVPPIFFDAYPSFSDITDTTLLKDWLIKDQNKIQEFIDDIISDIECVKNKTDFLFPREQITRTDFSIIVDKIFNLNKGPMNNFYESPDYILPLPRIIKIKKGKYGQFVQLYKNKDIRNEVGKMMRNNMELCKIEEKVNELKKCLSYDMYGRRLDYIYMNIIELMKRLAAF